MNTSNDLRHTIETTDSEGNALQIKIRLNDECKNGHQDFAITATAWQKGKPRTDKYFIYGGCAHEKILKARPVLKIFVDLHLCDYMGIPMHCSANGYYHLTNGFNNTPTTHPNFAKEFQEYYRLTPEQFEAVKHAESVTHYAILLERNKVFEAWKEQADQAIEMLEKWTGTRFLVDSKRTQYHEPTPEERTIEGKLF